MVWIVVLLGLSVAAWRLRSAPAALTAIAAGLPWFWLVTCALAALWPVSGPLVLLKLAVLILLFGALLVALGEIRRRELRRLVAGVLGPGVDA